MSEHAETVLKPYHCADCNARVALRVSPYGRLVGTPRCAPCWQACAARVRAARSSGKVVRGTVVSGTLRTDNHQLTTPDNRQLSRRRAGETCFYGHRLTAETLYVSPSGREQCRLCRAAALARYRERQRYLKERVA